MQHGDHNCDTMSVGEHSTASGEDSEDLLALLEQQCVASMGLPMAGASSSKRTLEQSEQESDDDEAWSGISEEDAAEKESQNVDEPAVIEFSEPRREMSAAQDKQGYKQFMVSFWFQRVSNHGSSITSPLLLLNYWIKNQSQARNASAVRRTQIYQTKSEFPVFLGHDVAILMLF